MKNHPPKFGLKFLRWFCKDEYLEEIEGNLWELFELQADDQPSRAKWTFFWQVLLHFRPAFIKSFGLHYLIHPAMIRHNLLITYRGFLRLFFINFSLGLG